MPDKSDRSPAEQEHHKKAFELYYGLGDGRSYKRLATQLGLSPSTIKHWSGLFHWRQRISEREADAARRLADHTQQTQTNERGRNRKIVQLALMKLARGIADGKVRMQMGDLDRLIRLQSFLDTSPLKPEDLRRPEDIVEYILRVFLPLDRRIQQEVLDLVQNYKLPTSTLRKPPDTEDQP